MSFYESFLRPILFRIEPETAHRLGGFVMRRCLRPKPISEAVSRKYSYEFPHRVTRFGVDFANPLGVAAGFDKNGFYTAGLAALGFGFVEVGTVTLRAQPGNPRPRLFRLREDRALINRMGFNNDGAQAVVERLRRLKPGCVLGVNIGRNRDVTNEDAVGNYLGSFDHVFEVADYVAVNVSSPNTPGLRELEAAEAFERLFGAIVARNKELARKGGKGGGPGKPVLAKISPDLKENEVEMLADTAFRIGLDGIIAANTTVSRQGLSASARKLERIGAGGLSGRPVAALADDVIRRVFRSTGGRLPVIGVGGIFSAKDAFKKIAAGASLLQAYTGFVYHGPSFARQINSGLAEILEKKGFASLDEAIGSEKG